MSNKELESIDKKNLVSPTVSNTNHCYATKAMIYSELAKCHRNLGDLRNAEKEYYISNKYILKKSQYHIKDPKIENSSLNYLFRRTAQVYCYGLNYINAAKSDIKRCEANLLISELLMSGQEGDLTTSLFIDFSKAVIKRIKAGTNNLKLIRAKKHIETVKNELIKLQHEQLIARCNWELAILFHLLRDFDASESHIKMVERFNMGRNKSFESKDSFRAKTNICILRSHIEREKFQLKKSKDLADKAYEFAEKSTNRIAKIDAHICRAETAYVIERHASISLQNGDDIDAFKEFLTSLKENKGINNVKINAICFLGLCKVAVLRNKIEEAKQYWEMFKRIEDSIEHQFILDHLKKITLEQYKNLFENFIIPGNIEDFEYKKHLTALKRWFYKKAHRPNQSKKELAKALGISRQTIYEWEKEFKQM